MQQDESKWLREGTTVYTLMHHGWRKGEEQFRNRLWFGLQYDRATVSVEQAEQSAAFIVKACNSHDALVAALKKAGEHLEACGIMADSNNDGVSARQAYEGLKVIDAALAAAGAES